MSLLTLRLIERIEEAKPGFLSTVDIFAGTSAGGINALLMAAHDDPVEALQDCIALWNGTVPIYKDTLLRDVGALDGWMAVTSNSVLGGYLREKLGDRTLGELQKRVLVPTFSVRQGADGRGWRPKVFHNFGRGDDQDLGERALDVGLATSAFPISFPIYKGFIDGGLFANNPSMCALAQILRDERSEAHEVGDLERVAILSVGTGHDARALDPGTGDWGWRQWLLNPLHPLAFMDLVIDTTPLAIDFQCQEILGSHGYFRVNPPLSKSISIQSQHGHHDHKVGPLQEFLDDAADAVSMDEVFTWLDKGRWGGVGSKPKAKRSTKTRKTRSTKRKTKATPPANKDESVPAPPADPAPEPNSPEQ